MLTADGIREHAAQVKARSPHCEGNEQATKMALIVPLLQRMEYDVHNPFEVVPEYTADFGTGRGEAVDYALCFDGSPRIVIECKSVGSPVDSASQVNQLNRCYAAVRAINKIIRDDIANPSEGCKAYFSQAILGNRRAQSIASISQGNRILLR